MTINDDNDFQGYELYKRGYGGGQGAAVEGKWKEGHVPDTSLVMQLVRLTLVRLWIFQNRWNRWNLPLLSYEIQSKFSIIILKYSGAGWRFLQLGSSRRNSCHTLQPLLHWVCAIFIGSVTFSIPLLTWVCSIIISIVPSISPSHYGTRFVPS